MKRGGGSGISGKAKSSNPINTDKEIAEIAGVGETKLKQYRAIKDVITPEQKQELRKGDKTINRTFLEIQRSNNQKELLKKIPKMPTGKYRVFLADPPWNYGNSGCQIGTQCVLIYRKGKISVGINIA